MMTLYMPERNHIFNGLRWLYTCIETTMVEIKDPKEGGRVHFLLPPL